MVYVSVQQLLGAIHKNKKREREREREHTLEPDQVQGEQQQQETTTTDDNYMLTITNQDMTIYRACAFG